MRACALGDGYPGCSRLLVWAPHCIGARNRPGFAFLDHAYALAQAGSRPAGAFFFRVRFPCAVLCSTIVFDRCRWRFCGAWTRFVLFCISCRGLSQRCLLPGKGATWHGAAPASPGLPGGTLRLIELVQRVCMRSDLVCRRSRQRRGSLRPLRQSPRRNRKRGTPKGYPEHQVRKLEVF